jgi:type II secretory pathway pseudopilin PulG
MKIGRKGFTLIELLFIIAVIILLAISLFIILNPSKRFLDARNSKRSQDSELITDALKAYQGDHNGDYPASVKMLTTEKAYTIGTNGNSDCDAGCTTKITATSCIDLTTLVTDGYLETIPKDPSTGTDLLTDYYLIKNSTGTVEVGSCDPEGGAALSVVR